MIKKCAGFVLARAYTHFVRRSRVLYASDYEVGSPKCLKGLGLCEFFLLFETA